MQEEWQSPIPNSMISGGEFSRCKRWQSPKICNSYSSGNRHSLSRIRRGVPACERSRARAADGQRDRAVWLAERATVGLPRPIFGAGCIAAQIITESTSPESYVPSTVEQL